MVKIGIKKYPSNPFHLDCEVLPCTQAQPVCDGCAKKEVEALMIYEDWVMSKIVQVQDKKCFG